MTAAQTPAIPFMRRPLTSVSTRVFGNLLRKELRESRGVIIAGLCIFWLMPALWELLSIPFDSLHHAITGVAWVLLVAAGWLYAIVTGAHTVCRDWGKAEERFLLAQPVNPRAVILAKLIAGAVSILAVTVVAVLWDAFLLVVFRAEAFLVGENALSQTANLIAIEITLGLLGVGYMLAFAAAVLTRQMLVSALLAALTLLVWAVAPLVSSRLSWVYPAWNAVLSGGYPLSGAFPTICVVIVGACIVASFVSCTREYTVRLGQKSLAWTFAVIILALSMMAMNETGNSLIVCDQKGLWGPDQLPGRYFACPVAEYGGRFHVLFWATDWPGPVDRTWRYRLASFRLDGHGRITDLRHGDLANPWTSPKPRELCLAWWRKETSGFAVNSSGDLVLSGWWREPNDSLGSASDHRGLWQARYRWPDEGPPVIVSKAELPWPPDVAQPGLPPSRLAGWSSAYTDRYAYFLCKFSAVPASRKRDPAHRKAYVKTLLLVFAWSDGPAAKPRYEVSLPANVSYLGIVDGRLELYSGDWWYYQKWLNCMVGSFDADHPECLATTQPAFSSGLRTYSDAEFENATDSVKRSWGGLLIGASSKGMTCVRDWFGLRVFREKKGQRVLTPECLGECRISLLTTLFEVGGYGDAELIDDSLYVDFGTTAPFGFWLGAYDVSDPYRPRRTGFYHQYGGNSCGGESMVQIEATDRHLVLLQDATYKDRWGDCMVTVFDRPKASRPRSAPAN
jgi:hypothetical protein